jgi:hypothetical protein
LLLAASVPALVACAPDFDPPSEIQTLRVLAVRKDKPYARPGETVTLRMLLADGAEEQRPVQVVWLAGCENPAADLYAGCVPQLTEGTVVPGAGFEFSFTLSPDIISSRPPPADVKQPPYGLAYVFFAACAGQIEVLLEETEGFPIACMRGGKRLGPKDFVAGYTAVFAYDGFTNDNPLIDAFEIDGKAVVPECVNEQCVALEQEEFGAPPAAPDAGAPDGGAADGGLPDASGEAGDAGPGDAGPAEAGPSGDQDPCDPPGPACIATCRPGGECPEHDIKLVIDPISAEIDAVARARRGEELFEQMWINYYTDGGSVRSDVRLLSDSTLGFHEDHGTTLKAPETPGPFTVWAVAHDNRGGASWARVRLVAR